jgi:hypothetical protein
MCAGLIAGRTFLRKGLLAVLGSLPSAMLGLSRLESRTHFGAYAEWSDASRFLR